MAVKMAFRSDMLRVWYRLTVDLYGRVTVSHSWRAKLQSPWGDYFRHPIFEVTTRSSLGQHASKTPPKLKDPKVYFDDAQTACECPEGQV